MMLTSFQESKIINRDRSAFIRNKELVVIVVLSLKFHFC